jgi:TolA-binding protein
MVVLILILLLILISPSAVALNLEPSHQRMRTLSRLPLLALCLAVILCCPLANASESQAFTAAEKAYLDADYKNADAYFGDFIQKFPGSSKVPEAALYQAQARVRLGDYNGALGLLSAHQGQAGLLGDWYLLCQGEAFLAKGDYVHAEADFSKLIREFPASPRRLTAVVNAALTRQRLSQWRQVVDLLAQTNGVFQKTASTNHANPDVIRGYLLLSEAYLAQTNAPGAESALQALASSPLDATNNWQRQYLLCRALVADGRLDTAIENTTNLLILADATGQRSFQAQSLAFQAGLFERAGRKEEALAIYQKNLNAGIPAEQQRQALLKTTDLFLELGKMNDAAQALQAFLGQFPTNECSDLATLTLGELRLRQFDAGQSSKQAMVVATNSPAVTNFLDQAVLAFQDLQRNFPHSTLLGKAQLDLGWCYWLGGNITNSQAAFQRAISLLAPSREQADAFYKLGDAFYSLGDAQSKLTNYSAAISCYNAAITNYGALVERYAGSPTVRTNLCEPALYQIVRASQEVDDVASVTNALAKLLAWFPEGLYTDRALLITGQQLGQRHPETARGLYRDFARSATNSPLLPKLELAFARTYEGEDKWDKAIAQYDTWLATFTNHEAQGRAEYWRARANDKAGNQTNALAQFTNFVALFPTNEYAPLAKWWVSDYYFSEGNFPEAEISYKSIFQNTNWAALPIAYEARMMAGRAAFKREGWEQARTYFLGLANDRTCPTNLQAQALFALGDTLLAQGSTNKAADYREAFNAYDLICKNYPSNALAAHAWGQKANCLLQTAQGPQDFASISNDFQQVLDLPLADVLARSAAEVGLAVTLEKQADTRPEPEKTELLNLAKRHDERVLYDNSFLRQGEKPDPFWTRKAGLEAARLAERLQDRENAINIYRRLQEMFPPLRLEDKIKALGAAG